MGCCRPHHIRGDGSIFFFVAFRNWFFVMDVAQLIPDTGDNLTSKFLNFINRMKRSIQGETYEDLHQM
jgi:hypothetical protein